MTTRPVPESQRRPVKLTVYPRALPYYWIEKNAYPLGRHWLRQDGMIVMASECVERDGRRWLHVSCSLPDRQPGWDDLREVKELFVGRDRVALQVFPPADEYVNFHPHVLHLWSCLDCRVTPDFRTDTNLL